MALPILDAAQATPTIQTERVQSENIAVNPDILARTIGFRILFDAQPISSRRTDIDFDHVFNELSNFAATGEYDPQTFLTVNEMIGVASVTKEPEILTALSEYAGNNKQVFYGPAIAASDVNGEFLQLQLLEARRQNPDASSHQFYSMAHEAGATEIRRKTGIIPTSVDYGNQKAA
jgi:hypothetical protein